MSRSGKIKPLENYGGLPDADVLSRGTAVENGINGNPNFSTPPVAPADLKAGLDSYSALIVESGDGSKKVIAQMKKQREAVIKMLRLLGRYVEVTCKNDMAIFKSSGFEPASTTKAQTQPLSHAIRKIKHGPNTGQLLVHLKAAPNALSYELRSGAIAGGGPPATWTTQLVTSVKTPVTLAGLTPGTIYAFQVRAMQKSGFTDWSDSATFMCT